MRKLLTPIVLLFALTGCGLGLNPNLPSVVYPTGEPPADGNSTDLGEADSGDAGDAGGGGGGGGSFVIHVESLRPGIPQTTTPMNLTPGG